MSGQRSSSGRRKAAECVGNVENRLADAEERITPRVTIVQSRVISRGVQERLVVFPCVGSPSGGVRQGVLAQAREHAQPSGHAPQLPMLLTLDG